MPFDDTLRAFFQQSLDVRPTAAAAVQHLGVRRNIQKLKSPLRHRAVPQIHHGDHDFPAKAPRACGCFQRNDIYHTSDFTHSA